MGIRLRKWASGVILAGFLLGIRGENLALWLCEDPEPVYIFNLKAESLPPEERILLQKGIQIANLPGLMKQLENYL